VTLEEQHLRKQNRIGSSSVAGVVLSRPCQLEGSPTPRRYAYFGLRPISSRQAREPSRTQQGRQNHKLL